MNKYQGDVFEATLILVGCFQMCFFFIRRLIKFYIKLYNFGIFLIFFPEPFRETKQKL